MHRVKKLFGFGGHYSSPAKDYGEEDDNVQRIASEEEDEIPWTAFVANLVSNLHQSDISLDHLECLDGRRPLLSSSDLKAPCIAKAQAVTWS